MQHSLFCHILVDCYIVSILVLIHQSILQQHDIVEYSLPQLLRHPLTLDVTSIILYINNIKRNSFILLTTWGMTVSCLVDHFDVCLESLAWSHALQWCHSGHDGVSNHRRLHCLLNPLFRRRSRKTSKIRITGLCVGNSLVTSEFPTHMASNAENVSIWKGCIEWAFILIG